MPADGQAEGLGPPDPKLSSTGAALPAPPDRSWLHLSLAHLPLDCPFVIFPAPTLILGFWLPWALSTPKAAPLVLSSVSLRLWLSFSTRRLSGLGITHPLGFHFPLSLHSAPGSAGLPGPLPPQLKVRTPASDATSRDWLSRGARNCSLPRAKHPRRHTQANTHSPSPSPLAAQAPAPVSAPPTGAQVLGGQRVPAGRRRPAIPRAAGEKSAESGSLSREGGRAGESAGGRGGAWWRRGCSRRRRRGAGRGGGRLGRGRDYSPAGARPGTLRSAHECTHTGRLALASCTGTPVRTPVPTCARSHSCTTPDTRWHTHPGELRKHTGSLRHQEPTARTARCSPTPPGRPGPPLRPRAERLSLPPAPSPCFPPGSPGRTTGLVAMATPVHPFPPSPLARSHAPPPQTALGEGGEGIWPSPPNIRRGGA